MADTLVALAADDRFAAPLPVRVHSAWTARAERRLLEALARRAPASVTADHLTALGLLAQCGAGLGYAAAHRHPAALWLVNGCVVLNWLGDSLDGTLARVRQQQRPRYGFYVDHMSDVLGTTALLAGMAASGLLHVPMAAALLTGFLLLAGESFLAASALGRFQLSQGPFGPTELRLLLIVGNLALLRSPYATVLGHRWLLFDVGGAIAASLMGLLLLQVTARHTAELHGKEPLR